MAITADGRFAGRLRTVQDALTPREWGRVGAMTGIVVGLNVLGWTMLTAATGHHYHLSKTDVFGLGTGVLAYTLGMRHAFDADHISAIDNTTRKLMADGKRPLSVGFFFSLGHSTIVFVLAVLLNFGIRDLDSQVKSGTSGLHQWTSVVGTSVSGFFLYLIAALNIVILFWILQVFRDMRKGDFDDDELDEQLNKRGLMNRLLGGFARRIDTPWKMYPVGVLFGLGFDTATEVALLVLSGTAVASGLPFYAILSLPVLFAAGMCLFDTLDGCFMNFAYGLGVLQADPQGVLQHHHHRALGRRRVRHRDDRDRRAPLDRVRPARRVLGHHGELQHQPGRIHHRRNVRGHLGDRPCYLALRSHRVTVGPFRCSGQVRERELRFEWNEASRAWIPMSPRGLRPNRTASGAPPRT